MDAIQPILYKLEHTFRRDDIKSAPREVLEKLIIEVYDDLTELNLSCHD